MGKKCLARLLFILWGLLAALLKACGILNDDNPHAGMSLPVGGKQVSIRYGNDHGAINYVVITSSPHDMRARLMIQGRENVCANMPDGKQISLWDSNRLVWFRDSDVIVESIRMRETDLPGIPGLHATKKDARDFKTVEEVGQYFLSFRDSNNSLQRTA